MKRLKELGKMLSQAIAKSGKFQFQHTPIADVSAPLFEDLDKKLDRIIAELPAMAHTYRMKSMLKTYTMDYNEAIGLLSKAIELDDNQKDKLLLLELQKHKDVRTLPEALALLASGEYAGTEVPKFRFHPEPFLTNAFEFDEDVTCDCCGKSTPIYYTNPFYAEDDIDAICPWCIASGEIAEKYDGSFQDDSSIEGIAYEPGVANTIDYKDSDIDELLNRTPGYCGWQQEQWLGHCNTPCAFVGFVGWNEIADRLDEFADIEADCDANGMELEELKEVLVNGGSCQGYLFQCIECGKLRLCWDWD